jgi:hypothetical protein
MTEAINAQQQPAKQEKAAQVQPSTSGQSREQSSKPQAASKEYGTEYYKGLIASDLSRTNGSSAGDMLKRNLQLAGKLGAE